MHRFTGWPTFVALEVLCSGVWGAFASAPTALYGYPHGLIYAIWSVTMVVPAAVMLRRQRLDRRRAATIRGLVAGLLGATGQLVLFSALASGPAYLVFPIVSLAPAVTVILAVLLLRERLGAIGSVGLVLIVTAVVLLGSDGGGGGRPTGPWLALALTVTAAWGGQAYLLRKAATEGVNDATTFAWMAAGGLLLAPVALLSTGGARIEAAWEAPVVTFVIQLLNACGALFLVQALGRGRASVVSPVTGALSPALTVVVSLAVSRTIPSIAEVVAVLSALGGSTLMVWSDARTSRRAGTDDVREPAEGAPSADSPGR
jgi:drug/metabolite transporter (DMT)-like permease